VGDNPNAPFRGLYGIPALVGTGAECLLNVSAEIIHPKELPVYANPHNVPLSKDKGEGF
jgi:hypothetical protein